jgi:hypothetical protein
MKVGLIVGMLALSTQPMRALNGAKPDFGPNVLIFNPSMPAAEIQTQIDRVYSVQQRNEFGPERNALLFLPGEYKVDVPVGFYTEVMGLGATPDSKLCLFEGCISAAISCCTKREAGRAEDGCPTR